ncbi:hypothetical protein ACIOHE_37435 [Streptomyces sp. NPDC087851]|uniref:hypothetical protein n=1 Tax=Streptomyces sp. NPDC087851 TaxID=3365810 RepID=UPI0038209624
MIDVIRLLPRSNQLARADGTVVKGSDDGVIWHDLHPVSGVDTAQWYEARLEWRASYRRIRIYDNHDGRCNLSGIEFASYLPDQD